MENLADILQAFIARRGLTTAQFVKLCNIERPTLYQYVTGKRPLNSREHLGQILAALQCTPAEHETLWEAWQIQQVGRDKYNRRKKIAELVDSLPTISLPSLAPLELWGRVPLPDSNQVLSDEQAVTRVAYSMIREAHRTGGRLDIILPPEEESLLNAVFLFHNTENAAQIRHIVCLDADVQSGTVKNIQRAQLIMKYGAAARSYSPLFYYGHADEMFGPASSFPGLIITDCAAMQISGDGKSALFHTRPEEIELFRERFEKITVLCQPLMTCSQNMIEALQHSSDHITVAAWDNTVLLCDLCDSIFWSEDFIRTYLNRALPNYEQLVSAIIREVSIIRREKTGRQTTMIMNPDVVRTYLQTGLATKYPRFLQDRPFSPKDRKVLVQKTLQACREGWYHLRFLDADRYPLAAQWELALSPDISFSLQHITDTTASLYTFAEPGIVRAAAEYFEMLLSSDAIMSEEDSVALLEQWTNALPTE